MRGLKAVSLILCAVLLLTALPAARAQGSVTDEIPYTVNDISGFTAYTYNALEIYTEEDGAAAGVPAGFTGYVMKLSHRDQTGIAVDFTDRRIPLSIVSALKIRIYYPSNTVQAGNGVRITKYKSSDWAQLSAPDHPDEWTTLTVTDRSILQYLCSEDGNIGKFGFGFRFGNGNSGTCYIDYIIIETKPDDGVAPVLTYSGATEITTTAGKPFTVNATAYDEYEQRSVPIDYEWSEGALDADGNLTQGNHTCTVTAADYYGNRSEGIVIRLTVGEPDTAAPSIDFALTEIHTVAGCIPALNVTASDDRDEVKVEKIWSSGALDARGRLKEGAHTLKLRAADLTGNTTEITVTVYVTPEFETNKPVEYEQ